MKNWEANFPYNVRFKANLALERGKVLKLPAMRMLSTLITLIIFPPILPLKILKILKVLKITKVGEVSTLPFHYGKFSSAWRRASVDFSKHKLGNRLMVQRLQGA
ncbi:hypothetical protein MCEGE11_02200 [Sphingomonadaceae bacterium]